MALTKVDITMLEDVTGANNLVKLDSNAKIPACSATGLSVKPGPLTSASDPTVSSNKALGTEWLNSTSGEMYICTDATAGENVWTNIGAGSGDVEPFSYQGTTYGYVCGGKRNNPAVRSNIIDKHSFTSNGNATDVGDLTVGRSAPGGANSETHGYCAAGYIAVPSGSNVNTIDRFALAATANATDVGDLTHIWRTNGGHTEGTYGWISGGYSTAREGSIEKWQLAASANGVDQGDLTQVRSNGSTNSSSTHGYACGGWDSQIWNIIDKFAFANSNNATDVGDLSATTEGGVGTSSSTHGYCQGGGTTAPASSNLVTTISKFTFASDGGSSNVGNLTVARGYFGQSTNSTTYGYCTGGYIYPPAWTIGNTIDKFPFSSDGNSTDVGDLTVTAGDGCGISY